MYFDIHPLTPHPHFSHLGKDSTAQFSWVWGAVSPQCVQGIALVLSRRRSPWNLQRNSNLKYHFSPLVFWIDELFRPVRSDLLSTDAKTHFIKLDFINKGIDTVNVPSILRSKSVTETVPTYFKEKEPLIISYTYTKTIASKIFNFSSTLLDLDCHQFHNNPSPCECKTSSHLYEPYGHVIAGDLSIIPNSKLRDLIAKGPKYREPCKVD